MPLCGDHNETEIYHLQLYGDDSETKNLSAAIKWLQGDWKPPTTATWW